MSFTVAKIINITTIARPIRNPTSWARSESGRPAHRLDQVEQKVTAIEKRHREQVQKADRDRDYPDKIDQRTPSELGHLAGNPGDADRSADLIGRLAADEHVPDIGQGGRRR